MTTKDGGPAFPLSLEAAKGYVGGGMSLRQWYAGMALQGMIASRMTGDKNNIAEWAFEWADAMIAEGKK